MSITPLPLILPQQLAGAVTILYQSSNVKTRIDKLSFTNTDSLAHAVTVYLVPLGGAPVASNTITIAHSVAAGETWNSPDAVGQILAVGGSIQAFADTGAVVTISGAGTQIS